MQTRWITSVLLAGIFTTGGMAQADMFDNARKATRVDINKRDSTGVSIRGGANLQTGVAPNSTTLLRGQATTGGGGCGFDFLTSFSESFEEIPALLEGAVSNVGAGLPLLVLCYTSPTVCDATKHWMALTNLLVQAKTANCHQIASAMQYAGSRLRGGAESQCLEDQVNAGVGIAKAMRTCSGDVGLLHTPDGGRRDRVDLVQETLGAAGASVEAQALAKSLLGEVRLSARGKGLGSEHERPQTAMLARYEARRLESDTAVRQAVEEYKQTGTVSEGTLQGITVPGQGVPLAALAALAALQHDPVRYESLLGKLTTGLSLTALSWDCHELSQQLASATEANSELTDGQRTLLEKRLEGLQRDFLAVMQRTEVVERHLQPALDALLSEYAGVTQAAAQAGLRAPTRVTPAMPFRSQMPGGYGQ